MNLGRIAIVAQGSYNLTRSYKKLDTVEFNGSIYVALMAIGEGESPIVQPTKWMLGARAGKDFKFADFTQEQINLLQAPANDAIALVDAAVERANDAAQNALIGIKGTAITTTAPSATGFERWLVHTAGTYTSFSGIVVSETDLDVVNGVANNEVILEVDNGVATKRVRRLKGDTGQPITQGLISINPQLFQTNHIINNTHINTSGLELVATDWKMAKIPIQYIAGTREKISISGQSMTISSQYSFTDDVGNILSYGVLTVPTNLNLTIPPTAKYLAFSLKRATDGEGYLTSLMVNYGATALPYVPYMGQYVKKLDDREILAKKIEYNGGYAGFDDVIKKVFTKSDNVNTASMKAINDFLAVEFITSAQLFKPSQIVLNKLVNTAGEISTATDWNYTSVPIEYIAGTQDKLSVSGQTISSSTQWRFTDSSGALLTYSGKATVPTALDISIPPTASKFEITVKRPTEGTGYLTSLMVNYGAVALPYAKNEGLIKKMFGSEFLANTDSSKDYTNAEIKKIVKNREIKKIGSDVFIRSSFDATNDLVMQVRMTGSQNGASNLIQAYLTGKKELITSIAKNVFAGTDSVPPPFQVQAIFPIGGYTNIAGNHGQANVFDIMSTAHGKATADLLSIWTDGSGWNWRLVEILDVNNLRLVSIPQNISGFDRFKTAIAGALSHVSGATNTEVITINGGGSYEFKPAINSISVKLYIDGVEITADGTYFGNVVKVIDTHNVADPTQPNFVIPYLPQNNGTMVKNTLIHTFYKNGSYTAENIADWQKSHRITNQGIIQPVGVLKGTHSQHNAYFTNIAETIDFNPSSIASKYYVKTDLIDQTKTVQQMSQILFDGSSPKIGVGFGLNPLVGVGKSEYLLSNTEQVYLAATKKYYVRGFQGITGTNVIRGIGYFAFWDATKNPKLSADYYVPHGNQDLYFLNIRQSMTKEKIYLNSELLNREFEIVHKSDGLTLHTEDTITSEGLTVTGAIGDWAVLKIK